MKGSFIITTLKEVSENFDNQRVPLSSKQRDKIINKLYPYYGAQSIIDYVDDFLFNGEYILIAEDGENLKSQNNNVCNLVSGKFWVNNHAHIIKAKNGNDTKYLYYYLNLLDFKPFITGSAQPKLTKDNLNMIPLRIHKKNEQKQITKVLSDLDTKIEVNNKINAKLEAMAKLLYDYWFVQFDFPDANGKPYKASGGKMVYNEELKREIPEGWKIRKFEKHLSFNRGISYTSKSTQYRKGIPMINLKSFNLDGSYRIDGLKYYNERINNNKLVDQGDLLIAITDVTRNAEIIGKAILAPTLQEKDMVASCDIANVISDGTFNKYYLRFLFNSEHYHNYIKHFASGTLVLHLDLNGVNWYKDIIPPSELQNTFGELVEKYYLKGELIRKQNQKLVELRDWLLPMLMNGQVTVSTKSYTQNKDSLGMVAEEELKYGEK